LPDKCPNIVFAVYYNCNGSVKESFTWGRPVNAYSWYIRPKYRGGYIVYKV
jgi:hypothetical protein